MNIGKCGKAITKLSGMKFWSNFWGGCYKDELKSLDLGIEALEKQIPKETHSEKYCNDVCCNGHYIPRLMAEVKAPYCPYCGQRLKYRSDNE